MVNVIIIDDEPLARGLVREYLQVFPQFAVLAECGDGFDGVKSIAKHKPDLLVNMPSGVYYVALSQGENMLHTEKMVIVK